MEQFALFMFYVVDKNYTPIVLRVVCLWLCLFSIWLDTFGYRKAKTKIEISMHFKLFLSHSTLRCVFRTTWRCCAMRARVLNFVDILFVYVFRAIWQIRWWLLENWLVYIRTDTQFQISHSDLFDWSIHIWVAMHTCMCVCFCMYAAAVTFFIIFIEYSFDLFACAYTFYHSNRIKVSSASSFSLSVRFWLVCRCYVR